MIQKFEKQINVFEDLTDADALHNHGGNSFMFYVQNTVQHC